jgi:L-asparaginase II
VIKNTVRVTRGTELESRHRAHGIVCGLDSDQEAQFGDSELLAFWRSAMKPFQALPLVTDGVNETYGFGSAELAMCCASHDGTPAQVEIVSAMLAHLGLFSGQLACGVHPPYDRPSADAVIRSGGHFTPLHNNCSGKHAGMLALALHRGWPLRGYTERDHSVQQRIRRELKEWLDVDPEILRWTVDGCSVPTPYLSLRQMARAYARLGRAAAAGERGAMEVVGAMTTHPELISGEGNFATRLMRDTKGRIVGKEGAEGVFCAAAPQLGWGLAMKLGDGNARAAGPAVIGMLEALSLLSDEESERLGDMREPLIKNRLGTKVGAIQADMSPRLVPETAPL